MNSVTPFDGQRLACVILAAGQGTRMCSTLPKVLHKIASKPLIAHVISACECVAPHMIVPVIAPESHQVEEVIKPHKGVIQERALGTGHAVKQACDVLKNFSGDILVLFGDTPLVTGESILRMIKRKQETHASIVVSGFEPNDPAEYGRLIVDQDGGCLEIVEYKDATQAQRAIGLCNGGMMLFDGSIMWDLLNDLEPNNAKNEYYLTDCIKIARLKGLRTVVALVDDECVFGINTRKQLAEAEGMLQNRLRCRAMQEGVTMIDPSSVFMCVDTVLGRDVVIEPNVMIGPNVEIADGVTIKAFSHLEGAKIGVGAVIGPFARIRPYSCIGEGAHIGNFVEIKNSTIGQGAKANHLAYVGDAEVGAKANIGAGTITCNYDGFHKSKTVIGEAAFIGSNSSLVAPVEIGAGAIIGAGSVITHTVSSDALSVTRVKQTNLEGWAKRFRDKNRK